MKRSRRKLSIGMVIHRDIFKINQIISFPCFIVIPTTGTVLPQTGTGPPQTRTGLPKTGLIFYSVRLRTVRWDEMGEVLTESHSTVSLAVCCSEFTD